MRIAQFTSSLIEPLGGAEQYCLAVARQQRRAGHDVTVLTGWLDETVRRSLLDDGIDVRVLATKRPYAPDGKGDRRSARLEFHGRELLDSMRRTGSVRALEQGGFDVVHVHRFAGFGSGVLAARGVRTVHTVHDYSLVHTSASLIAGGKLLQRPGLLQSVRRRVLSSPLGPRLTLVFPSARTFEKHLAWGLRPGRSRVVVLPHGWSSPASKDQSTPPRATGSPSGDESRSVAFLFLGKLSEHKGVSTLLEAWGSGIPHAVLRIAGDGPLAQAVAEVASSTVSAEGSAFEALGWLDENARTRELGRADALVMPSEWPENFPIVVAESLLLGRPVITTAVASPPLVVDGVSGLVSEPGASGIRSALTRFVADSALRDRLRAGAAAQAVQLDMSKHLERLQRLYLGESDESGPTRSDGHTA